MESNEKKEAEAVSKVLSILCWDRKPICFYKKERGYGCFGENIMTNFTMHANYNVLFSERAI